MHDKEEFEELRYYFDSTAIFLPGTKARETK